jgi:hypothetical protein
VHEIPHPEGSASESSGSFPLEVKTKALVACRRFCCLCEQYSGIKMHCHHIVPVAKGGPDTFENCIPLCLNCHAEVEAYNDRHPMGNKFRPEELKQRRDTFYKAVQLGPALQQHVGLIEADRATFADLQACLPSTGNIRFVRESTFGFSFPDTDIKELEHFQYDRSGPEHEFLDEELESQRKQLRSRLAMFLRHIGHHTFRTRQNFDYLEVPEEWEIDDYGRYQKAISDLGAAADKVCESYDSMIRLGRKKLA